jgi:N-acetylated-alpha-linked acidic dipeptidase
MVAPTRFVASLREDSYDQDPDTRKDPGPTYLGMSASGDVTAPLIYANSGNPADYEWLKSQGIDPRGKIAIVRYSNPYSYRGFKALTAERYGVKAMLIYSDPAEDGFQRGATFPDGPWGPESHIQRGALTYDYLVAGDPLTPGWASVPGAKRIPVADAVSVPKLISVPLSYRDARPLLEQLGGPTVPKQWEGALPISYRAGPGPAAVRVEVAMDGKIRPIWVVEARIRGTEEPDQLVVLGNHRDAWVYGAVDPSSGTATQLELARALGGLAREGYRPRRTLVMASWDAEEWHLTGSTEWGEQLAEELGGRAVAYLNVDGSTSGSRFGASAVASLSPTITEVARDVADPATGKSLLEAWAADEWATTPGRTDSLNLVDTKLGSGSDYTVFLNFLGLPIVDLAFTGPYGVYHSIYDNYYWMTRYGDPGFRYMTAMADVWGRTALRLANAEVLPFDFERYAKRVGTFLDELGALSGVGDRLDLGPVRAAQRRWLEASVDLATVLATGFQGDAWPAAKTARVNQALREIEPQWRLTEGIPGRPWFKHVLYAPKYTYAAMELPGVREAVDASDWGRAKAQLAKLGERIEAVTGAVRRARTLAAEDSVFRVVGPGGATTTYDVARLRSLPSDTVRATPHHGSPTVWRGVRLVELLRRAGISIDSLRGPSLGWTAIAEAADGYRVAFSLAELAPGVGATEAWLAFEEAGGPIPANVSPYRLVVPTDSRPARWARQVQSLVVVTGKP